MKIGFIGAGKVAFSLGRFFVERQVHVTGYYSLHKESAEEAAQFTNTTAFLELQELINQSDAIFITVPDGRIRAVYNEIKHMGIKNKYICHCSGAMSAEDAFFDLADYGAFGFSIHPLFPISSKYESYGKLSDAFFCLEGDENRKQEWEVFLRNLGLKTKYIAKEDKVRYHCACSMASNLVCALMAESLHLMEECGFGAEEAVKAITPLALSNMQAVLEKGPTEALTGPIERNDVQTVSKHMACLDEKMRSFYVTLATQTVSLAQSKHPDTDYSKMKDILRR